MKRGYKMGGIYTITGILFIICLAVTASATKLNQEDGIMPNHSAEYVRTLNRNTSTDTDAAFYNPAGLSFMKNNGLYVSFTSQAYYVKKTHTMDYYAIQGADMDPVKTQNSQSWFRKTNMPEEYQAELLAPCLPGLDIVWKSGRLAVFFDLAVMQAATDMTYHNGVAEMDWGVIAQQEQSVLRTPNHLTDYFRSAEAIRNEMYIGFTVGGSYALTDWYSAGGGFRLIDAKGNMKLKMKNIYFTDGTENFYTNDPNYWDIDTDSKGLGYGVILSNHLRPGNLIAILKDLEATVRLEYYFPLILEKKTNKFASTSSAEESGYLDIFKDGSPSPGIAYKHGNGTKKLKVTYPPSLDMGLSYRLFNSLKIEPSFDLLFNSKRDLDGREKNFNNGYRTGCAFEYQIIPEAALSTGYLYTNTGIKPEMRNEVDPLLNYHQVGAGACFNINDRLKVDIGWFYMFYIPASVNSSPVTNVGESVTHYITKEMDENRLSVGVQVTYRLFGDSDSSKKEDKKEKDEKKKKDIKDIEAKINNMTSKKKI